MHDSTHSPIQLLVNTNSDLAIHTGAIQCIQVLIHGQAKFKLSSRIGEKRGLKSLNMERLLA